MNMRKGMTAKHGSVTMLTVSCWLLLTASEQSLFSGRVRLDGDDRDGSCCHEHEEEGVDVDNVEADEEKSIMLLLDEVMSMLQQLMMMMMGIPLEPFMGKSFILGTVMLVPCDVDPMMGWFTTAVFAPYWTVLLPRASEVSLCLTVFLVHKVPAHAFALSSSGGFAWTAFSF